jgi:hypothetical protein
VKIETANRRAGKKIIRRQLRRKRGQTNFTLAPGWFVVKVVSQFLRRLRRLFCL